MDFFEHQEQARRKTHLLVAYFIVAVVGIVLVVYVVTAPILLMVFSGKHQREEQIQQWVESLTENPSGFLQSIWRPQLFLWLSSGTLLVIAVGSLQKFHQLKGGGGAVATMLGGRPLNPHTTDVDEIKARNVVEEMAIASGTPVPEVYILDKEEGINAFAAGHTVSDAAIGLTRGCLKRLNRDELQGVVAHEFSHLLNGDTRFNLRLIGLVNGILCIALLGQLLVRVVFEAGRSSSRSSRKGGGGLIVVLLLGAALVVIGYIGYFFARLIKSAVARQREFLADASAVQFTRNPSGIVGALKKIGGTIGSRLQAPNAEEASHLFFGNGLAESWTRLLSTHPTLTERIRAIDPTFNGRFAPISPAEETSQATSAVVQMTASAAPQAPLRPPMVVARVGRPTPFHLEQAQAVRAALPPELVLAVREPCGAIGFVYALVLSQDAAMRKAQLQMLGEASPPAVHDATVRWADQVAELAESTRLPLVDLALPALRQLSADQYELFSHHLRQLIEFDSQITLFEYTLQKLIRRHLEPHFVKARKPLVNFYVFRPLLQECSVLLSALAWVGQEDPGNAEVAFHLGTDQLPNPGGELRFLQLKDCNLPQVDAALDRLGELAAPRKGELLNACAHTVAADGVIKEREAELLRAIADTLDCPIPPLTVACLGTLPEAA